MLTAALVLCLAASAGAYPDVRSSDSVAPIEPASQDLRSPDTVTPAAPVAADATAVQDLRSPDAVTPVEPAPASAATSSDVTLPVDGGLNVFMIVLISLAGAVALAGAAYTTMRLAHHRPPAA